MHTMRLDDEPFNLIKQKNKTVELQLNDSKIKKIKVGDKIEFTNLKTLERIIVNIRSILSFREIWSSWDINKGRII